MILNNAIRAGNFVYCMIYYSPYEEHHYTNEGDGHYHPYVYIVEGQGWAEWKNKAGEICLDEPTKPVGTLFDIRHSRGYHQTMRTSESGLSLFHVNPIPATRELNVDIINGPIKKTITAGTNRITIVVISGSATINDKDLSSLQHSKIFPGKTVELTIPEHAICAVVNEPE
jgi:hypothetical protein